MSHKSYHKNTKLTGGAKFLLISAVTLLMLFVTAFAALFVMARGPWDSFSEKLCGTMCEINFPFTDVFFTSSEIKAAKAYTAVAVSSSAADPDRVYKTCVDGLELSGEGWRGYIAETTHLPLAVRGDRSATGGIVTMPQSELILGLSTDVDAYYYDGTLYYKGEGGREKYCFCALGNDGYLYAGELTVDEAAEGNYFWGVSAERVLVSGGKPVDDLAGGYAARAAIGQRADGSFILFSSEVSGLYPCGISYEELASIMYEYGAVTAAAVKPAGGINAYGTQQTNNGEEPDLSIYASWRSGWQ